MRTKKMIYFALMFLPLLITVIALPFLPEQIPAHYNFAGEVDRFGSKYETLVFPVMTIGMGFFMLRMAKIASKDENGKNNEKFIFYTGIGISLWFTAMHCYFLFMDFKKASNLNDFEADINQLFCILFGILLIATGSFMPRLKNNGVIGLRTPWSMKNDETWKKSQLFGGISFIIGGIIMIIAGIFMEGYAAMCAAFGIIIICTIAGTIYSYKIAQKY